MAVGGFEQKFKMPLKKKAKNKNQKQKPKKRNDLKHVCIAMSRSVGSDLQNLHMSAIL